MANLTLCSFILLLSIFSLSNIPITHSTKRTLDQHTDKKFFQNICQGKTEKIAKLHFYVQDALGGDNATVYEVARSPIITANSPTDFGQVRVLDNLVTATPDPNSKKLGRVQGLITSADLATTAIAMNLNFYFTSGKTNGSTISILGRNQIMNDERELPVAGGTGIFRYARGYAVTKTYSYDVEAVHGVLEYTIYVTYDLDRKERASDVDLLADM